MNICTRCAGTGLNGNCEVCGGSGFISLDTFITPHAAPVVVNFEPMPVAKGKRRRTIRVPSSAPSDLPNPMAPEKNERICGLSAENLSFPSNLAGFKQEAIRQQIKALTAKLNVPEIHKIRWGSPVDCIVAMLDGTVYRQRFGQHSEFAVPHPPKGSRTNPGKVPAERTPKVHHRTIPHPSQAVITPKPQPPKGKRMVRVVRDGVTIAVIENPRSVRKIQRSKPRPADEAPREKSPRSIPDAPTAFELAFAAARGDSLDGSREWSGLRDVTNGRYGSHPAFDASDDTIDT